MVPLSIGAASTSPPDGGVSSPHPTTSEHTRIQLKRIGSPPDSFGGLIITKDADPINLRGTLRDKLLISDERFGYTPPV